jgi:GMP synthase (glutamine-hydrolysing)
VRALAFRHVLFEGPGLIEDALQARGVAFDYCDLFQPGAALPDIHAYDGLIFMGGPMSANDNLPFLAREMRLIEAAAVRGQPVLGICLGSQLIAKAMGARVYRNSEKEIGWFEIELTEAGRRDRILRSLAPSETVFHWHSDTFDLPPGAEWLARSARTPHQAFRLAPSVYGLQFHLEVTPAMIVDWSREDQNRGDMEAVGAPLDPWLNHARCRNAAFTVFGEWCGMLVPAAAPAE